MKILARDVAAFVAADHGLTLADLRAKRRTNQFAHPRMIAMHLIRTLCPHMSYPAIGTLLNRDHTTVLSADRRIARLRFSHPEIGASIDRALAHFGEETHRDSIADAMRWNSMCAAYGQAMGCAA